MAVEKLSASNQDYLKAIWSLGEWSDEPVTVSKVAAEAGVRVSTASDAMRKLGEKGLVHYERYGAVTLTEEGHALAVAMVRRHRLIEAFLVDVLGYSWDQVHDEAESLEHAVSDFMIERIDALLGYPERDPHGDPTPRADGSVSRVEAEMLSSMQVGAKVRVVRISDSDPDLLRYFSSQNIGVDTTLEVLPPAPFSDTTVIRVADSDTALTLGAAAAEAIWVR